MPADRPRVDEGGDSSSLPDPEPVAHTLTIEFGRFLTEEEWRTVVSQVKAHVPHVQGLRVDGVPDVLHVGDTIWFSTALLQQISEAPDQRSRLVTVARIFHQGDGSKLLQLQAVSGL